jgi:hypothetical protein
MNELDTNWKLESPSLTLYAFHLRNDITTGNQQVVSKANALWEQCISFGKQRDIFILKSLKVRLRSYTDEKEKGKYQYTPANEDREATEAEKPYLDDWLELARIDPQLDQARHLVFDDQKLGLKGEIYPLRIHDTYAVELTLRYQETVDFSKLKFLNPTNLIQGSLGQTLLLFAKPVNVPKSAYQDFANHCVKELLPQQSGDFKPSSVGQLFGSPIFEYDNENSSERYHILVWLNCHSETLPRIAQREAYYALLNLLCCRHKIIYAYSQSRQCERDAQSIYSDLEQQIKELPTPSPETLSTLSQWLKQSPLKMLEYSKLLRNLQDHQSAIATNIKNYHSRLRVIESLSLEDNLRFLQNFFTLTCKQFQEQIEVDLRYLTPAQGLFQQVIDTIRGLVEIYAEEQQQQHMPVKNQRKNQDFAFDYF